MLEGFSVETEVIKRKCVIIFDCVKLHCASNFLDNGTQKNRVKHILLNMYKY